VTSPKYSLHEPRRGHEDIKAFMRRCCADMGGGAIRSLMPSVYGCLFLRRMVTLPRFLADNAALKDLLGKKW
jgi:hypothetical protein